MKAKSLILHETSGECQCDFFSFAQAAKAFFSHGYQWDEFTNATTTEKNTRGKEKVLPLPGVKDSVLLLGGGVWGTM